MGVGGSFSSFLENVFGKNRKEAAESEGHNPFANSADDAAAGVADEAVMAADAKPAPAEVSEPSRDADPETVVPEFEDASPAKIVTTVRPDIMLHIDEDGESDITRHELNLAEKVLIPKQVFQLRWKIILILL